MRQGKQITVRGALSLLLLLGLGLSMAACATTRQTRSAKKLGFLKDYSQLRKGKSGEAQYLYINPQVRFSAYKKLMIDPISVRASKDGSLAKVPRAELQDLANHLYGALLTQLVEDFDIVSAPGPGVMRLRVAITEAQGSNVWVDVASNAITYTRVAAAGLQLATDTYIFVGKAAIEGEILDSQTSERLMAAVDERAGTKVWRGSLKTWGDVKDAYDFWANRLKERLREEQGIVK
jgi:hypothetical protein